jgi:endo-1,4-beta-xylanase
MKSSPIVRIACLVCLFLVPLLNGQPGGRPPLALSPWLDPETNPTGLIYGTFESEAAGCPVSYAVYLPTQYETQPDQHFPVVYWLHGRGGWQNGAGNFARRMQAAADAGKVPPLIVVGVNGRRIGSWIDTADGKSPVQSMLVHDLVPHIDASYRTIARRETRAIEGFSMGGAGAPKIGFKFPEVFGIVGVISGALHDYESYATRGTALQDLYGGSRAYFEANSPWNLVEQNADQIRGRTFVRVAVGDADALQEKNTAFHELLTRLKIDHDFDVIPGATHNPGQVYDGLGDKTWVFYRRALEPYL